VLGSSGIGLLRLAAAVIVALVGAISMVGAGSAWATTGHAYEGQFGGLGDGDGQFGEPLSNGPPGVGVMATTGEVFTADAAQFSHSTVPRVQRFDAAGEFQSAFALDPTYEGGVSGLAVDPSGSGAVYVATGSNGGVPSVVKYSTAGVKLYALDVGLSGVTINARAQVAVDPVDGTVYATAFDGVNGVPVIAAFSPLTGVYEPSRSFSASDAPDPNFVGVCPAGLTVDGLQRVYVLDSCKNRVDRFDASGAFEMSLVPPVEASLETLFAVTADPVSNEVYVSHSGSAGMQVTHFSAGGAAVVYTFDAREVGGVRLEDQSPRGMAVSGEGMVYISDSTRPVVARYERFEGPTVVTGGTSTPEARSVTVEGTINPESVDSRAYFEYSTDLKFESRTEEVNAGTGSGPVAASALLEGLRPNTTYNYRLVGASGSRRIAGTTATFRTEQAPPDVDGSPAFASAITPRSARLHGTVNPNTNDSARWYFEYGTTTAYGRTADAVGEPNCFAAFGDDPCNGLDRPVIGFASGLEPATTYHFRVVADAGINNPAANPQYGADQTFVTAPAAGSGATDVTSRRARLTGTINPHGVATTYHFNYGTTSSYGTSTPEVAVGSGNGDQVVAQGVTGLVPDTTYHVQVVATDADGVVRSSSDGLFRTAPAPVAAVIGSSGVSTDTATVAGEVNTFGLTGTYHFDVWSLDSGYAVSTPRRAVAGSASAERVSADLAGLPAGETFVVQLTVASNDSTGVSDQETFATAAVPRVFPAPPGGDPVTSYGCGAPRLNAYGARPKPGDIIAVTGRDLGVGGSAVLGDRSLEPVDWSVSGFKLVVPEDAAGTLGLTVNCGRRSNTVAVAIFDEPDSRFAVVSRSVSRSTASLRVQVPGPGKIESFGVNSRAAKVTIKKAGTATLKVRLSQAGAKRLGRASSRTLKIKARVRFTPSGGNAASKTVTITFKRGSGR
jgi:hypothetical protein